MWRVKKVFTAFVWFLAITFFIGIAAAKAGSLTPSAAPGSTMRSLSEIFNTLAGTYDSSAQIADIDGNVSQQLKYIAGLSLQNIYTNSSAATITTTDNKTITFSLADTATDSNLLVNILGGNKFEVQNNGTAVFTVNSDSVDILSAAAPTVDAAGEIAIDSTIANQQGTLVFHNGTAEQYTVALAAADLPTTDDYVLAYDADNDKYYFKAVSSASSAYDDIGDPDADSTIAFAGYTNTWTSTLDTGTISTISNTDSNDFSGATSILDLKLSNDGDANGYFLRGYDNSGNDLKFSIGSNGAVVFGSASVSSLNVNNGGITNGGNIDATAGLDVSGGAFSFTGTAGSWTIAAANSALTQTGTGTVIFTGNVDAGLGLDVTGAITGTTSLDVDGSVNLADTTAGSDVTIGNATGNIALTSDNFDTTLTDAIDDVFQIKNATGGTVYFDIDLGAADAVTLGNAAATLTLAGSTITADNLTVTNDIALTSGGSIATTANGNLTLLPNGSGITIVGDAGATSHTLNTNDDLFIAGRLEVDGAAYFDSTITIAPLSANAQKGITLTVSADTDGDIVYGTYSTVNTGTGTLAADGRFAYGVYNSVEASTDTDVGENYQAVAVGVRNDLTVTGEMGVSTGVYNYADANLEDYGEIEGVWNYLSPTTIITPNGGNLTGVGNAIYANNLTAGNTLTIYGVRNDILTTSAGGTITAYGVDSNMRTKAGDTGYHISIGNGWGASTGGTQYGFYSNVSDTDITYYPIYEATNKGYNILYSNTRIGGTTDPTNALSVTGMVDFSSALALGSDLTIYEATNDGSPEIRLGSADAEELHIQANYTGGAQTLASVTFTTDTALAGADSGKYIFNVDGADILTIDDGGIDVVNSITARDETLTYDALGATYPSTAGLVLQNTTAATNVAAQYSPALEFITQAWSGTATQTDNWRIFAAPIYPGAHRNDLQIYSKEGAGAWTRRAFWMEDGSLVLGSNSALQLNPVQTTFGVTYTPTVLGILTNRPLALTSNYTDGAGVSAVAIGSSSSYSAGKLASFMNNTTEKAYFLYNGSLTIYDASNDGSPTIKLGAADAEELTIQSVYDSGAQTLDYVKFTTDVASGTADKGKFVFNVDGTDILTVNDGGIEVSGTVSGVADQSLDVRSGEATGDTNGTTLTLAAGDGGAATTGGVGGDLVIYGGNGGEGAEDNAGGKVYLFGGNSANAGADGWVSIGNVNPTQTLGTDSLMIGDVLEVAGAAYFDSTVTLAGTLGLSSDLTIYEATNDGSPEIRLGSADAEELHIQSVYDGSAQTLNYVLFQTDVASGTADKGKFVFNVDGSEILNIRDSGALIYGSAAVGDGAYYAPSMTFSSDADTGFYLGGSGQIYVTTNSALTAAFTTTAFMANNLTTIGASAMTIVASASDNAAAIAVKIGNSNPLSTSGAKIISFYSDNLSTEKAYIDKDGLLGLDGGITMAGDITDYEATSDGSPEIRLGSADAEELHIQANYTGGAQTLASVTFTTDTALAGADSGKYIFNVDGTDILTIDDGGLELTGNITLNSRGTISDDGTTFTILPTTGDYVRIGDAGTTSQSLAANDDLLISGKLEVNGITYFDAGAYFSNSLGVMDGQTLNMGTIAGTGAGFYVDTTQDQLIFWTGTALGNSLIITGGNTNRTKDHDLVDQTNPTLAIFSATSPDTSNNEYGLLAHNQANFVLSTGANVGTGTGPTTINNGFLVALGDLTAAAAGNYGVSITRTLSDAASAGGETYTHILANLTETDKTGWPTVSLLDLQVGGTSKFLVSDTGDLTIYDASNDGNPLITLGAATAEKLTIKTVYDAGVQTLDYVEFVTAAASGTADKGKYIFDVDGTDILTIDDGGLELTGSVNATAGFTDGTMTIDGSGAITGVTSLAMGGALSGVTTLGMSGDLTMSGNTVNITHSGTTSLTIASTSGTVAIESVVFTGGAISSATSIAMGGTLTGLTTAITGTKNNALAISVPTQGTDDANGVGISIVADDAGSGGTGNHNGGILKLNGGEKAGTGYYGYTMVGASGAASFNGAIYYDNSFYVQGRSYLDGFTVFNSGWAVGDNAYVMGGTVVSTNWYSHVDTTNNQFTWGVGSGLGRQFLLVDSLYGGRDFDIAAQTDPLLGIFSGIDPDISNNQYGAFSHNQTNLVLSTGANVGTGTGATTINNGFLVALGSLTSGAAGNYGVSITRTLSDAASAGGETYTHILANITETNKTGWPTVSLMDLQVGGTSKFLVSDTGDLTIYDASNDGSPTIKLGAADAEELTIQSVYDTGAQTLNYVQFTTDAASATADKGQFKFNVDGTEIARIDDGGLELDKDILLKENGSSVNSGILYMQADAAGTTQTAQIQLMQGADPWLQFYIPIDGTGSAATVLKIKDDRIILGTDELATDAVIEFWGNSNSGTLTYMEDEDRFDFAETVKAVGLQSTNQVIIYNGTDPSASVTDAIILYAVDYDDGDASVTSELFVRDEDGNETNLSPHNFSAIPEGKSEEMAWSFFSRKDDKEINVDMTKVVRILEELTGEQLIYIKDLNENKLLDKESDKDKYEVPDYLDDSLVLADIISNGLNNGEVVTSDGATAYWSLDDKDNLITAKAFGVEFETSDGKRVMFSLLSDKAELMISGSSTLTNGQKIILFEEVDPTFAEIISHKVPFKVILTPTQNTQGLYVSEKMKSTDDKYIGFTVRELNGGNSNIDFDWMVMAVRAGYEPEEEIVVEPVAPSTEPTVENPPIEDPDQSGGADNPPAEEPPAEEPVVENPPVEEEPAAENPPEEEPPIVEEPPVEEPPVE
ncbi:MAG: hypothetical protein PHD51_02995 [Patescibacteria group bacterium]|nr:hypothetical protein [Patescibacteria group bacterium]MDD5490178.1 hypothetical protein [Patescibacteria group bacterium]